MRKAHMDSPTHLIFSGHRYSSILAELYIALWSVDISRSEVQTNSLVTSTLQKRNYKQKQLDSTTWF
jgi:hypothetical protein